MDIAIIKEKGSALFKKYKYILLILAVGMFFMLIPDSKDTQQISFESVQQESMDIQQLSNRLSEMLSFVKGAGQVQVMLTVAQGQKTVYQTDTGGGSSVQTVLVTDSQRNEAGLISQINGPIYQGAVVLCQGADDPQVRLAITEAVSKITGLGANQIAVLKMK